MRQDCDLESDQDSAPDGSTTHHRPLQLPRALDSCAYDTAWVASLADPQNRNQPRFPAAFNWLLDKQHPDGSWGGAVPYQHDRLLSTLSAIRCLTRFPRRERTAQAIARGQRYIWQHAHEPRSEPCELVGFELLLPTLLAEVTQAGVALPSYLDAYEQERARKLALIPESLLYSSQITLAHSLEFLGPSGDASRLLSAVNVIGSIGNSPAATAYLLSRADCPPALRYLQCCLAADAGQAVTVLHPCEMFDWLWSAYHLFLGGVPAAQVLPESVYAELRISLAEGRGISLSDTFPIPDADDTAVAMVLLSVLGEQVSPVALAAFEKDDFYTSFPYERHPSVGVNVHVLDALHRLRPHAALDGKIGKLIDFIGDSRLHRTYWIDKWHISPYYATSHAIAVLNELQPPYEQAAQALCAPALEWIRATQREDGSWGYYATATAEETAYAVVALARATSLRHGEDAQRLRRAAAYLRADEANQMPTPPLWIDKCLYNPPRIVAAIRSAALRLTDAYEARS